MERLGCAIGQIYGATDEFGYNAIAFDSSKVTLDQARNIDTLMDPGQMGNLAIYDYYLPIISQLALKLGKAPADLVEADLPAIKDMLLAMTGAVLTMCVAWATQLCRRSTRWRAPCCRSRPPARTGWRTRSSRRRWPIS